ncbi:uncharacterized protein BDV17DRAFT_174589 [Aspergillus undulatus]|uniref:uncharacterized protein n=1 Tax=Aspergillus undulatus TaxID=1810928 RepID=UPI003CCCF604
MYDLGIVYHSQSIGLGGIYDWLDYLVRHLLVSDFLSFPVLVSCSFIYLWLRQLSSSLFFRVDFFHLPYPNPHFTISFPFSFLSLHAMCYVFPLYHFICSLSAAFYSVLYWDGSSRLYRLSRL